MTEKSKVVPIADGVEHGFYGDAREDDPNHQYTVAGQAGATAKVTDAPAATKPKETKRSEGKQ
ncbi:hypothetical protein [Streptomonospora wellingtoniae]|uniref:Uncharacterized protein n=1 Tax=Streptomonospora wellingtoniae TaxID=3075544 RepID=A0ABU2KUC8_9ACTN|nr:hypothetical protein [Streptomonospora sp. DSM 45055]MDT0302905.1 hypothetical protein [Streptomonospora sp. DSM 45055]